MSETLRAHTPPKGGTHWHRLDDHLRAVAERGAEFADAFDGAPHGRAVGLLHDLGKANPEFQDYLHRCFLDPERRHRGCDHKGAGTLAVRSIAPSCPSLACSIAGHHGGLHDRSDLKEKIAEWKRSAPRDLVVPGLPPLPDPESLAYPRWAASDAAAQELFTRLLFSALVDADALDTERHWTPEAAELRARSRPSIAELADRMAEQQRAIAGRDDSIVQQVRDDLARSCQDGAASPPGLFRLTAPTGSGKTRSALSFALEHARIHGMRRVISVAPYLSITDQTADAYRALLGGDAVLEHHSDAARHDPPEGGEEPDILWRRLAAQTWDAPVIVTTAVQFFESLFSNRTSRCRKNHRIAKSVVILDEVQTLPTHLLDPMLDMLRLLITHAGVSVVLSTATQPAYERIQNGVRLPDIRELAPQPVQVAFRALKRVRYEWPDPQSTSTWDELAGELHAEPQALVILNTRKDALALLERVDDDDTFHLSTLLCAAHRRAVLSEIRKRLQRKERCRVIATQVVEAGVDLDFPLVMRALGPLDRVVQAAGRCNREGKLPGLGRMRVFIPEGGNSPTGAYRTATDVTRNLLSSGEIDPDDPETIAAYFGVLLNRTARDRTPAGDNRTIQKLRRNFDFATVASLVRLIDDDGVSMLVPFRPDPSAEPPALALRDAVAGALRGRGHLPRTLAEQLQPFTVSVRTRTAQDALAAGRAERLTDGLYSWLGDYDEKSGIRLDAPLTEEFLYV